MSTSESDVATPDTVRKPELHLDVETRATVDLKKVGMHVYFEHPETDLWCACFCVDDGEIETWRPGDPVPEPVAQAVAGGWTIIAHNAAFEREAWLAKLGPRYGWPLPADEQFHCTAAMAAAMALPRNLDGAAAAMGMEERKDHAGSRLMLQLCRPRSIDAGKPRWWDVPEKVERLVQYCRQDVVVERELTKRLRALDAGERQVYLLDQRINSRGVAVDLAGVRNAKLVAAKAMETLNDELSTLTKHSVTKASNAALLTHWLRGQGLDLEGVAKADVLDALELDLAPNVRRVLEIRKEAARSSLAKLDAFLARTSKDGRARGALMYHGAGTGRWSGVGIQLQNLLRPWMKYRDIECAIELLGTRDPDWLTLYGAPLDVVANCMRSFVTAAPGHELVMADFANIEGRVLAWLAGEEWKLNAFRAFDSGNGPDLYLLAAAGMFGIPLERMNKDSPERQVGKVSELALGYQGGHGAFISMAGNYNLKVAKIAPVIQGATDSHVWEEAAERYTPDNRFNLCEEDWTALRVVVDGWRRTHPAIADPEQGYWKRLEEAAFAAVRDPGSLHKVGKVAYACSRSVLWCRLPSGRLLAYADPQVREVETPWGATKRAVTYTGVNSVTRRWERHKAYGGLWAENVTQATARDVMAAAMFRVEAKGWPVVLTVHDEIVSEVLEGSVTAEDFGEVMRQLPPWGEDLPVAAEGLTSKRYRK